MMTIGSLFSGIGLLDLGVERAGLGRVKWLAEKDSYCASVLSRHWPDAEIHSDVVGLSPQPVDVLCGGFPCQPFSVAGNRNGKEDERYLWPEYKRIINETEPKIVIAENVPGLRSMGLRDVLGDLAGLGFDSEWCSFRASDLGAPHHRLRIFIVATHPHRIGIRNQPGWLSREVERAAKAVPNAPAEGRLPSCPDSMRRLQSAISRAQERGWSELVGWDIDLAKAVADGRAKGLAGLGAAKKALGNAVVVQCAEVVGKAIMGAIAR